MRETYFGIACCQTVFKTKTEEKEEKKKTFFVFELKYIDRDMQ